MKAYWTVAYLAARMMYGSEHQIFSRKPFVLQIPAYVPHVPEPTPIRQRIGPERAPERILGEDLEKLLNPTRKMNLPKALTNHTPNLRPRQDLGYLSRQRHALRTYQIRAIS